MEKKEVTILASDPDVALEDATLDELDELEVGFQLFVATCTNHHLVFQRKMVSFRILGHWMNIEPEE